MNYSPAPAYQQSSYFVRSSNNSNVFYLLQTDGNRALVCSCKAAMYIRKPCRHVRAVIAGQALVAQPKGRTSDPLCIEMSDAGRELADMLQV